MTYVLRGGLPEPKSLIVNDLQHQFLKNFF